MPACCPAPRGRADAGPRADAGCSAWDVTAARRADPCRARLEVVREQASPVEVKLTNRYARLTAVENDPQIPSLEHSDSPVEDHPFEALAAITTAERSFGAHVSGMIERQHRPPAGALDPGRFGRQSFGAFANELVRLELIGQANDYVGKASPGHRRAAPGARALRACLGPGDPGNTCLYGRPVAGCT